MRRRFRADSARSCGSPMRSASSAITSSAAICTATVNGARPASSSQRSWAVTGPLRMRPRGLPDRLHDHVDPRRQPVPRLEDLSAPSLRAPSRLASLCWSPTPGPAGAAECDDRGGHPAARALHQHGRARLDAGLVEQHPVRGQPGRRQAGRLLEGQRGRLGHQVAPRYGDALGEAPSCRSESTSGGGPGSRRRRPVGSPITACTTTSLPSSSTPPASQPSTIGSRSGGMPTPRSVQMSWWLSAAAFTVTVVQPSGGFGSDTRRAPDRTAGHQRQYAQQSQRT